MDASLVKDGATAKPCYCKRCGLTVLLATKGRVFENSQAQLRVPKEGPSAEALEWEVPDALFFVATQFDFENVCFSRNHRNLPNGMRILTCAGCEQGVLGVAVPEGEGPDIKMSSYLHSPRVSWEPPAK